VFRWTSIRPTVFTAIAEIVRYDRDGNRDPTAGET